MYIPGGIGVVHFNDETEILGAIAVLVSKAWPSIQQHNVRGLEDDFAGIFLKALALAGNSHHSSVEQFTEADFTWSATNQGRGGTENSLHQAALSLNGAAKTAGMALSQGDQTRGVADETDRGGCSGKQQNISFFKEFVRGNSVEGGALALDGHQKG